MNLNELIKIASAAYPDELVAACWDFEKGCPRLNPTVGDTLASFIAAELADTYEAEATDALQITAAMEAISKARDELGAVVSALATRLGTHSSTATRARP